MWFVDTCNLGHLMRGPQEALWNTVKGLVHSRTEDSYMQVWTFVGW
jgi:hypothetical protein